MSFPELAVGALWGMNLLGIFAANFSEIKHCLAVLLLYSATRPRPTTPPSGRPCVWSASKP